MYKIEILPISKQIYKYNMGWKNKDIKNEYQRKWRKEHPEGDREYYRKYTNTPEGRKKKQIWEKRAFDKKKQWVDSFKIKCIICKEDFKESLAFHHINPEDKKYEVSNARSRNLSYKTIEDEIKKCVVLCHNCHAKVEYGDLICPKV